MNNTSHLLVAIPVMLSTLVTAPLFAKTETFTEPLKEIRRGPNNEILLTVTANRREQAVDETLVATTVFTEEDIKNTQASHIIDILHRIPGVSISTSGGTGTLSTLRMRGTEGRHTLILINGIKTGDVTDNTTRLEYIPTDNIKRIEIIRGPRSSLYGSEAIGGVINIITKQPKYGFSPEFSISMGSENTLKGHLGLSSANEKGWYQILGSSYYTDGIDAILPPDIESDDDGFHRDSLNIGTGYKFNKKTSITFNHTLNKGTVEYDGFNVNKSKFKLGISSISLKHNLSDKINISTQLGRSSDERNTFKNTAFLNTYKSIKNSFSTQGDINFYKNTKLVVGTDLIKDSVISTVDYDVKNRKNTGIFANYQNKLNKLHFEVGARHDDNEQFGTKNTGNLALSFSINPTLKIGVSHGTSFAAPKFDFLYFPEEFDTNFNYGIKPNPNLLPESAKNTEINLSKNFSRGSVTINLFDNKLNNHIQNIFDPESKYWQPFNISKSQSQGIEFASHMEISDLQIKSSASYIASKNKSSTNYNKDLQNHPRKIANFSITKNLNNLNLELALRAESKRFINADNSKSLPGFATMDIHANYKIDKHWQVRGKIGNLLNKSYATNSNFGFANYNTLGRHALFTLEYNGQ